MKRVTLDFGSGRDFRVVRSSPASGSTLLKILSPCAPPCFFKKTKNEKNTMNHSGEVDGVSFHWGRPRGGLVTEDRVVRVSV